MKTLEKKSMPSYFVNCVGKGSRLCAHFPTQILTADMKSFISFLHPWRFLFPRWVARMSHSAPPPQPKSCPALSGDARAEDVKLILGYTINPISDCSVFSFLLQHLLSRTASSSSFSLQLQLIWSQLSSNALSILRVVLCPQVITYQVWSLWGSTSTLQRHEGV